MEPAVQPTESNNHNERSNRYRQLMMRMPQPPVPAESQPPRYEDSANFPQCHTDRLEKKWEQLPPGAIFQLVVVGKCDREKQLQVYVWKQAGAPQHKQIGCYGLRGIIRDYEIKEDFSIFSYCQSYKMIRVGCHLQAAFLRTLRREEELLFEFSLRNNLLNSPERIHGQLGIISNEEDEQALAFFQREGLLPLDYQIAHDRGFENLGGYTLMQSELQLERHSTMAPWSNKPLLGQLDLHYERIRKTQNHRWAKEYLTEAQGMLKRGGYAEALECLNLSLKFDEENPDVHAAKGLALANTVQRIGMQKQLADSLRSLKRALQLDPLNKVASDYYEKVRTHLKAEQKPVDPKGGLTLKRRDPPSQYNLIHKK